MSDIGDFRLLQHVGRRSAADSPDGIERCASGGFISVNQSAQRIQRLRVAAISQRIDQANAQVALRLPERRPQRLSTAGSRMP